MSHEIAAEMVANVLTLVAEQGAVLEAGDTILILESMKMEIPVLTETKGTLVDLRVSVGDVVQVGDVLAVVS